MNTLVSVSPNQLTMSSREMADLVEKRHDSVKRTVDTLVNRGVISQPQIVDGPKSANGVHEKQYLIGRRDTYVVVAQLCPEFTARIVDRWQELESTAQFQHLMPLNIPTVDEIQKATAVLTARDNAVAHLQNKILELGGHLPSVATTTHNVNPKRTIVAGAHNQDWRRALSAIRSIEISVKDVRSGATLIDTVGGVVDKWSLGNPLAVSGLSNYGIRVEGDEVWIGTSIHAVSQALLSEFGDATLSRKALHSIPRAYRMDKTVKFHGVASRVVAIEIGEFVSVF